MHRMQGSQRRLPTGLRSGVVVDCRRLSSIVVDCRRLSSIVIEAWMGDSVSTMLSKGAMTTMSTVSGVWTGISRWEHVPSLGRP